MIKCPTHGPTHITACCPHIGDAVDANRFERARVVIDDLKTHRVLCEQCQTSALDLEAYCHQDLIEWYAATGQGNLSEAIARARAHSEP
jgi:hypothetical protein